MESACSKRKPSTQLTKDQLQGEPQAEVAETESSLDLKDADANTLKNRRRLKIVRTHAPPAVTCHEQQSTKEASVENKETPAAVSEKEESPGTSAASAPEIVTTPVSASAISSADVATSGDAAPAAPAAADTSPGATAPASASASATDGVSAADANGKTAADNNPSIDTSSGGIFGSLLKGAPAFVSPFGALGPSGNSFLLPSGGPVEGHSSLLGSCSGSASAEADETDVPPPEEPTVVTTTVDSKEEVIFTDRDCRMQCFDIANKVWTPKPPLDGKVDFVTPKKGEEEGLPNARILFFVNRTGRLRLNSPVLPSTVKFRHPVERSAVAAGTKAVLSGAAAAPAGGDGVAKDELKDIPLKMNTVEFTGLKLDAKDAKDTTFYRIRFSSDERAAEFMALANAKQEEAGNVARNGSTN
ncbi:hypothetical protein, conserved [Eimeria tenella]|uniref:RanBD1 domain-containing protein n=1 Tax=Eimeria tenella TaxID=5802 RepID=H9B9V1_EIMTE|nr:hypothetical protein, conserved [Eimeria tenella]AET50761.1 hypothetical protein [Eimeria tenella]CDJ38765.1 hypothetical protein, conserved [Eimeria tenella]|eukprot:XP_013229521.1 hypothetical protein, conserved [Eimeria tenella]